MSLSVMMLWQKYTEGLRSRIKILHVPEFNLFEHLPETIFHVITVITDI